METTAPGGINKTVIEIAKHLSIEGHNVTVLQANPLDLPTEEIYDGFKIIRVKTRFSDKLYGLHPEFYSFFKRNIARLKPDIVHIHGYHTLFSLEAIFLIKKTNPLVPLIFSPHFDISSHNTIAGKYLWNFYNSLIGKKVSKFPALICAASRFEAKNVHNILGVPENKIKIIPHGVDIIELNDKIKNKNKSLNILYTGYLLELKGVQYAIKALNELVTDNKINTTLTIFGKGPYEKDLKAVAEKLNVNKNIDWKGFVSSSDLIAGYKKADVFILASISENYGIVVAEALALGTPVIVTKTTALNEFLDEPGCFGINYPPDPKKLAQLILKIYHENPRVGPFSNKIRTWDKVVGDYERLYYKICNIQMPIDKELIPKPILFANQQEFSEQFS